MSVTLEDLIARSKVSTVSSVRVGDKAKFEGKVVKLIWSKPEDMVYIFTVHASDMGRAPVTVVGKTPVSIHPGLVVSVEGVWVESPRFGMQLKASAVNACTPTDSEGLVAFLSSRVPGIGPILANRMVDTFGSKLETVLAGDPQVLTSVKGVNIDKAKDLVRSWKETGRERDGVIFLMSLGFTMAKAGRIVKSMKTDIEQKVRENAYCLMKVPGVGAKYADIAYFKLGGGAGDSKRLFGLIVAAIGEAAQKGGHLYLEGTDIVKWLERTVKSLGLPKFPALSEGRVMLHVDKLAERKELVRENSRVYDPFFHHVEARSAAFLKEKISDPVVKPKNLDVPKFVEEWQASSGITLSDKQKEFLLGVLDVNVSVLTGLPGTGKSTVCGALVSLLKRANLSFALCAPTGMAAKRLAAFTGESTYTMHRYLGANGVDWSYNASNPREEDVVIVDETSMVDQALLYRLLDGARPGCRFVFVGDAKQLPSVGPGIVLSSLVKCGKFRVTELSRIYRQQEDSLVVENAHRIAAGRSLEYAKDRGFVRLDVDEDSFKERLHRIASRIKEVGGNCMFLSPIHAGAFGVSAVNNIMQDFENPPDPSKGEVKVGTVTFRVGDKVVICANDYGRGVVNGDVGIVTVAQSNLIEMTVDGVGLVSYDPGSWSELKLGYCLSVHKSQGGQADWVVVVIRPEHVYMLTRRLFYTAITRAKKKVVILGDDECVRKSIDNLREERRNSGFATRLSGVISAEDVGSDSSMGVSDED